MNKNSNDASMSKLTSLKDAANCAPNSMGCYQIYKNGKLIYVGKAEDGIRKRFVQYYNGTTTDYTSGAVINLWKDELQVQWKVLDSKEAVRRMESYWIGEFKPLLNTQSGWGEAGQLTGSIVESVANTHVSVLSPEMAVADCIGGAAKTAVKGAVAVTAGVEVIKSIANGDCIEECLGNAASKSCEAAVSAGAGAVAGEVAGFAAVALGAGPIGMGVATLAAAAAVGSAAAECADGAFDEVKNLVEDAAYGVCGAIADVGYTIGSLFWWL